MWSQTEAGHFQHFTITKFRAIENRIWYARAANDGVTAFINPHGQVVSMLPIKEVGYLTGEVTPRVKTTLYTRYGDVLPKAGLVVLIVSFLFSLFLLVRKPSAGKKR
jgi:apolipoprotein N-acyltransferase